MRSGLNILLCSTTLLTFGACAGTRPYPARLPMMVDTDLRSVYVPCRIEPTKKDPNHIACAPEAYVSPLVWDGVNNSVFRPLARVFAVDPAGEAVNVNAFDEVPDSAWFTNRIGTHPVTVEDLQRGACSPELMLDDENAGDATWVIDQGKPNGASPGFRVNLPGKGKYMFKADSKEQPERPSAASVIGAAVYHNVGFYTSCEQIVYFKPSMLKLTPGLRFEDNSGIERNFDEKALQKVLDVAAKKGDRVRMQASAWLPGRLLGPFQYNGKRSDDPNDVINHEDRRELRGGRILAAWLHHFDAREQNSMDSWIADDKKNPDSSPGYVRHYYLDTSDCLGSEWDWDEISRRLGHSYLLDWGDIGGDFITLGTRIRPWERLHRSPGHEIFGYYGVDEFVPDAWKNEYPNPSFSRMSEHDGAWMARILARFTPEMVQTLAKMGEFSKPDNTDYLGQVLEGRLVKILDRYLTRTSPMADLRVEGNRLCGTDLAARRGLRGAAAFRYSARFASADGDPVAGPQLTVENLGHGDFCVNLPPVPAPYVHVSLSDGVARGPLLAHLYGPQQGRAYLLAGIERPDPGAP
ncbi:hypothetical protein LVJ94_42885 [Pendulispora rubella]|uniref:Uncharacterized protein n=1 Tax=Pendulispora rubella TaxID=2741070 RepID=A0ABZ2KY72_9BACT